MFVEFGDQPDVKPVLIVDYDLDRGVNCLQMR